VASPAGPRRRLRAHHLLRCRALSRAAVVRRRHGLRPLPRAVVVKIAVDVLLALGVAVALLSSIGIVAMRDPYQRLHFISPPATLSALCVTLAIFLGEKQKQAGAKAALVAFLLYFMNAVVTHATARAHFVREKGTWPPPEPIEVVKED